MELDLEEAVRGTTVSIRVPTLADCKTCKGSGAKKGTSPVTCTTCNGMGQVRMQQGFFAVQQTCPRCHGSARWSQTLLVIAMVKACEEEKTLSVKCGRCGYRYRIRFSGEGGGCLGGPSGDLYVVNLCVPIQFST